MLEKEQETLIKTILPDLSLKKAVTPPALDEQHITNLDDQLKNLLTLITNYNNIVVSLNHAIFKAERNLLTAKVSLRETLAQIKSSEDNLAELKELLPHTKTKAKSTLEEITKTKKKIKELKGEAQKIRAKIKLYKETLDTEVQNKNMLLRGTLTSPTPNILNDKLPNKVKIDLPTSVKVSIAFDTIKAIVECIPSRTANTQRFFLKEAKQGVLLLQICILLYGLDKVTLRDQIREHSPIYQMHAFFGDKDKVATTKILNKGINKRDLPKWTIEDMINYALYGEPDDSSDNNNNSTAPSNTLHNTIGHNLLRKTPYSPTVFKNLMTHTTVNAPFYYQGNKYAYLDIINYLVYQNRGYKNFIDLFGGSGIVCANIVRPRQHNSYNYIYNDLDENMIALLRSIQSSYLGVLSNMQAIRDYLCNHTQNLNNTIINFKNLEDSATVSYIETKVTDTSYTNCKTYKKLDKFYNLITLQGTEPEYFRAGIIYELCYLVTREPKDANNNPTPRDVVINHLQNVGVFVSSNKELIMGVCKLFMLYCSHMNATETRSFYTSEKNDIPLNALKSLLQKTLSEMSNYSIRLQGCEINQRDFRETLRTLPTSRSIIYSDSPYTATQRYPKDFSLNDMKDLISDLKGTYQHYIFSCRACAGGKLREVVVEEIKEFGEALTALETAETEPEDLDKLSNLAKGILSDSYIDIVDKWDTDEAQNDTSKKNTVVLTSVFDEFSRQYTKEKSNAYKGVSYADTINGAPKTINTLKTLNQKLWVVVSMKHYLKDLPHNKIDALKMALRLNMQELEVFICNYNVYLPEYNTEAYRLVFPYSNQNRYEVYGYYNFYEVLCNNISK